MWACASSISACTSAASETSVLTNQASPPPSRNARHNPIGPYIVDISEHDASTVLGEEHRRCFSDTAGAAGDNGCLFLEASQRGSFPRSRAAGHRVVHNAAFGSYRLGDRAAQATAPSESRAGGRHDLPCGSLVVYRLSPCARGRSSYQSTFSRDWAAKIEGGAGGPRRRDLTRPRVVMGPARRTSTDDRAGVRRRPGVAACRGRRRPRQTR